MKTSILPSFVSRYGMDSLQNLSKPEQEKARTREAAKEFEALMVEMMVREMRKNVPESPIFGRDTGREIFNEMLDSEYVRIMVDQGGLGLADMLVKDLDLKKQQ